ncbi:unnamed protein product [Rotaria sp. Silwood2]|nr:unnamed protein product [Rotaria sp. Silwood2]CAF3861443.1 unnamed protein product [Rotaria sp. Silwood2]
MRFIRENVNDEQDFSKSMPLTHINLTNNTMTTTPLFVLFDDNNNTKYVEIKINKTNNHFVCFSHYSSSTNKSLLISSSNKNSFSWEFDWNLIILLALGLIFVIFLISIGLWYWCKRVNHLHRQHSLPLSVNDFIETTKIQEKHLSSSPINKKYNNNNNNILKKPPPVPPRPTAYTTIPGKIEYRSNL